MLHTLLTVHSKKPTKWNIKAFVNAKSSTGYVLKFEIYVGDSGSAHDVVMKLMDQYLDKGHNCSLITFIQALYFTDHCWIGGHMPVVLYGKTENISHENYG